MFYAYDHIAKTIYRIPTDEMEERTLYKAYDIDGTYVGEVDNLGFFCEYTTDAEYRIAIYETMEDLCNDMGHGAQTNQEKGQVDVVLEWLNQEMKVNAAIDVEFSKNLPVYMDLMYERLSQLQKNEYEFDEPGYYLRVTVADLCNGTLSGEITVTSTPSEQGVQAIDSLTEERVRAIAQEEMRRVFIRFYEGCIQLKESFVLPDMATPKQVMEYLLFNMPSRLIDSIKK